MASPYRSESFSYGEEKSTSPSILLVPTRYGDSDEVVLGLILSLVRSKNASPEQEGLLAIKPVGPESTSIEIESPYAHAPTDESRDVVVPESEDNWVEDMIEQAAIDYDYVLMRAGWRSNYITAQTWIFQLVRVLLRFMTLLVRLTSLVILLRLFLLLYFGLYFILQLSLARLQVLLRRLMCLL
jgi:hypothetical protein